jgi:hypothetical protein
MEEKPAGASLPDRMKVIQLPAADDRGLLAAATPGTILRLTTNRLALEATRQNAI